MSTRREPESRNVEVEVRDGGRGINWLLAPPREPTTFRDPRTQAELEELRDRRAARLVHLDEERGDCDESADSGHHLDERDELDDLDERFKDFDRIDRDWLWPRVMPAVVALIVLLLALLVFAAQAIKT